MRVANWKADKIFMGVKNAAVSAVSEKAEEVAERTRVTTHENPEVRAPRFSDQLRGVSFVPSKGRGKGKLVSFKARVWLGRKPGDLKSTIRVVEKPDKRGNFRVIAGNYKIYWARFAEYGVPSRNFPRSMFMRESFDQVKATVSGHIEKRIKGVL